MRPRTDPLELPSIRSWYEQHRALVPAVLACAGTRRTDGRIAYDGGSSHSGVMPAAAISTLLDAEAEWAPADDALRAVLARARLGIDLSFRVTPRRGVLERIGPDVSDDVLDRVARDLDRLARFPRPGNDALRHNLRALVESRAGLLEQAPDLTVSFSQLADRYGRAALRRELGRRLETIQLVLGALRTHDRLGGLRDLPPWELLREVDRRVRAEDLHVGTGGCMDLDDPGWPLLRAVADHVDVQVLAVAIATLREARRTGSIPARPTGVEETSNAVHVGHQHPSTSATIETPIASIASSSGASGSGLRRAACSMRADIASAPSTSAS